MTLISARNRTAVHTSDAAELTIYYYVVCELMGHFVLIFLKHSRKSNHSLRAAAAAAAAGAAGHSHYG